MKKLFMTTLIGVLAVTLLFAIGCGKGTEDTGGGGTAGTDTGEVNLLTMLPDNASGVFTVNFKKLAKLDMFDKMIKDAEAKAADKPAEGFKSYQDFVDKTGIDPKTDLFGIAVALLGKLGPGEPDAVVVANLNYDKAKILAVMAEKELKYTEELYKDVAILKVEDEKKDGVFAFVKDGIIAFGKVDGVKKVIDLAKGEGKSVMDNPKMKAYIDDFKADALISMAVEFPEDAKKVHQSPMGAAIDLTKAEVILGHFNYSGSAYTGEIALVCPNEEGNKQVVTTLNGFKGMAAMGGPEVMELVNNLTLSASDDKVTLAFNIPEALLEKLQKKMGEKAKGMMPPPGTEETEETKK
ncbi:MAG: hypothetical protein GY950_34165 [bacterium]|nr:hypothetical protein [bacterium]